LNIAGMTITGTSLSARGGNGGNALKPDTPGSEGGAGGIVFVASANTFDPPPNVNGGKGGLTAGRPGTPGRAVIQRFADAARANLFAQARETFQLNAALASAAPPADTPAVAINFVGSSDLSAETLKSLEAVVGSLQRDAALGVVLMPAGGQTVDAKLQLERSDAVLGYLLEKGVDPGQITASSDTKVDRAVGGLPVSGGAAWLTTIPGTIQQF